MPASPEIRPLQGPGLAPVARIENNREI